MAELADAPDLGSGVYDVQVQVLLSAVFKYPFKGTFFLKRFFRNLHRGSACLHGLYDNGLCR